MIFNQYTQTIPITENHKANNSAVVNNIVLLLDFIVLRIKNDSTNISFVIQGKQYVKCRISFDFIKSILQEFLPS